MTLSRPLVGAVGAVLAVVAYPVLEEGHLSSVEAVAVILLCSALLALGLVGWNQRPWNRVGPMVSLFALTGLLSTFQAARSPLAFTVGYAVSALPPVILGHLLLSYPSGRLRTRLDRLVVAATYVLVVPLSAALLLFYDPGQHRFGINDCRVGSEPGCPRSLFLIRADPELYGIVAVAQAVIYPLGAVAIMALLVRRVRRATPRARRILLPLLIAAGLVAARIVAANVLYVRHEAHRLDRVLFWTAIFAQLAVAVALLAGVLRARLAHAAVGQLMVDLEHTAPDAIEGALARAVGDASLRVAFWLPELGSYVDSRGQPVELPSGDPRYAVTALDHDGKRIAALIHDAALGEEEGLVEAAGGAAGLALENAQLQAEVRAQMAEVAKSRLRIVAAADAERRRVERDIHDGAQQRLLALALELRMAQRSLGDAGTGELERVLAAAVDELQVAVHELRELARGVYPAILTEDGLGAALHSLATRTPLDVSVIDVPEERLPGEVEAAAYFLVCEALANTVKHARASHVTVRVVHDDGRLTVAVTDDGVGGARAGAGSGLRGLSDRLAAHGGHLRIDSPPGGGTAMVGEIPCAS